VPSVGLNFDKSRSVSSALLFQIERNSSMLRFPPPLQPRELINRRMSWRVSIASLEREMEEDMMSGRDVGPGNAASVGKYASSDSESAVTSESAGDFDAAERPES
jgi:hypothetical protein